MLFIKKLFFQLPYDKNLADYDYVRQRKCNIDNSHCDKKKQKVVPDGCISDKCRNCAENSSGPYLMMTPLNYDCKKNPFEDCPPQKISPAPVDRSQDVSLFPVGQ